MKFNFAMGPGMFRAFLASAVLVDHLISFEIGATAVYLFFILSGYWILEMWGSEYGKVKNPIRTFYISRAWRILPTFLLASILANLTTFLWPTLRESFNSLPFTEKFHYIFSNIFVFGISALPESMRTVFGSSWSLDVEVQFYLIAPVIIYFLTSEKYRKFSLPVIFFICVTSIFIFAVKLNDLFQTGNIPVFIGFFLIGMFLSHFKVKENKSAAFAFVVLSIFIITFCLLVPSLRPIFLGGHYCSSVCGARVPLSIILALLLTPYALLTLRGASSKGDRFLGNISYQIYLFQLPIFIPVNHFFHGKSHVGNVLVMLFSSIVIYIVSYIACKFIDIPIQRRRSRFVKARLINDDSPSLAPAP